MTPPEQSRSGEEQPLAGISGAAAVIRLLNLGLRHARLIGGLSLLLGVLAFVFVVTRPRMYTATASFLVQAPKLAGSVPGIAAQLGFSLPVSDPGQSPAFYAEMIRSRGILSAVAESTFVYRDAEGVHVTATLADAYHVRPRTPALRRDETIGRLGQSISVRTSLKSGVVTFSVTAPDAELVSGIVEALLGELVTFNIQRRQSQAAAERRFTQRRLAEVASDLRTAEGTLEAFLRRNRSIGNSPQLTFEQERLTREMELRRMLYTTIAQSYEQAKIEEVRDTPQMTIVEHPEVPARPNPRLLVGKSIIAATFGALLGLLLAFTGERVTRAGRESGDDLAEFVRLRNSTIDTFRRPFQSRGRASPPNG